MASACMFVITNGEYEVNVIGSSGILSRMLEGGGPVMVGKGVVLVFANAYLNVATGDVDVSANSDTKWRACKQTLMPAASLNAAIHMQPSTDFGGHP